MKDLVQLFQEDFRACTDESALEEISISSTLFNALIEQNKVEEVSHLLSLGEESEIEFC